jgi:biopolymer transport protein ExbB
MKKAFYLLVFTFVIIAPLGLMAQATMTAAETADESLGATQMFKKYFIEGDWIWMSPVLISFIFGLALCIERILVLNLASINTRSFITKLDELLGSGKMDEALKISSNTPGPVASLAYEGLRNVTNGGAAVEKAIINYGAVEMGMMEKGLSWIALFISLAPMLGFLGTVVGMMQSFENIEAAGDISPTIVAGGIKVALITTVFGLIVAIILQIFYNYILSKIDALTIEMEESSIAVVEMAQRHNLIKN